jgi:Tfp pilus assembly protein PilW
MNALALILIVLTVLGAVLYEISRRRTEQQARRETREREALDLIAERSGEVTA